MSSLIETLSLGKTPRIVGTIITEEYLGSWLLNPQKPLCDLVELRLDGFPQSRSWLEAGKRIEEYDVPVFATVRLSNEGGKWTGVDSDRWPLIEAAVHNLAGIDVEIQSNLADLAARSANDQGKFCVLSYHDFQQTPSLERMRELLLHAHSLGAIGKIAATVNTGADLENLRSLLTETWELPICVIGMGPLGRETRLSFPTLGSCFTYGYLDTPGAPGQYSALELMRYFGRVSNGADTRNH